MRIKILLFSLLLWVGITGANARPLANDPDAQEVYYRGAWYYFDLENGERLTARILYMTPDQSLIEVQAPDGEEIILQRRHIRRATLIVATGADPAALRRRRSFERHEADLSFHYGLQGKRTGQERDQTNVTYRYGVTPHVYIGAGIGVGYVNDLELTTLPLFVNFRFYGRTRGIMPYIDLQAGYGWECNSPRATWEPSQRGPLLEVSGGIGYIDTFNFFYAFSVGYHYQGFYNGESAASKYTYRGAVAIGFTWGLRF